MQRTIQSFNPIFFLNQKKIIKSQGRWINSINDHILRRIKTNSKYHVKNNKAPKENETKVNNITYENKHLQKQLIIKYKQTILLLIYL